MKTVDIITIAFNNLEILKIQYEFIKKNVKNNCIHIILDNSTDINISRQIAEFCNKHYIMYFKFNIINSDFSNSHGLAVNNVFKTINFQKELILLLDHDIIPIKEIVLDDNIKDADFYGLKQINSIANNWYLRPVLFLCKNNKEYIHKLNFLPCPGGDPGGSCYESLFKYLSPEKILNVTDFKYYSLSKSIDNFKNNMFTLYNLNDNIQEHHSKNDLMEYMDGWLHFINTSDWCKKGSKMHKITQLTNLILSAKN